MRDVGLLFLGIGLGIVIQQWLKAPVIALVAIFVVGAALFIAGTWRR